MLKVRGMGPPSGSMYDTFRDGLWDEFGPLDPDWFDALIVKASTEGGHEPEQDTVNTVTQDGGVKSSFDKTAVDSQFSTPKIFKHRRVLSPQTEDEQFYPEQEKEAWTIASPCLFGTSKEATSVTKPHRNMHHPDSFELLNTPNTSSVDFAQRISESLGAQINPNVSWTSSLNTPPALPSTLILSKSEDSPCPVSRSADRERIIVRNLFPSLPNVSRVTAVSPKQSDIPTVQQAIDGPGVLQATNTADSPQCSLNQRGSDGRQTLPDAIEDGGIRSTVESVLDGAENALFTNSNSVLRRVKADRIKRKQRISTREHGCSSTGILTLNNLESSEKTGDQRADDQEVSSSPHLRNEVKTADINITQWSPMSLSDISHCAMDTSSCHVNDSVKQQESKVVRDQLGSDSDLGQPVRPSFKNTDSMFSMKKRRFVYTIQSSKPTVRGKDSTTQKIESSPGNPLSGRELCVKQVETAPDEAQLYNGSKRTCDEKNEMLKQGNVAEENPAPLILKQGDVAEENPAPLILKQGDVGEENPAPLILKQGDVGEENPAPLILKQGDVAEENPAPLILKQGDVGEENPAPLILKQGDVAEENPAPLILKQGDVGEENPAPLILKQGDVGEENPAPLILKQGDVAEENPAPLIPAKGQDLDDSQLCRAFAQEFTPMSEPRKPGNAEEHTPRYGFSPSACLSALKQRKKRLLTNQESTSHHHDCNPTAHLKDSNIKSTVSDSIFQSTMADVTQMTASSSILPEKEPQSQPKEKGKPHVDDSMEGTVTDAKLPISLVNVSQTLGPSTKSTSTQRPSNERKCIKQNGQGHTGMPQQTTASLPSLSTSGLKTASKKGIKMSSVSLERPKSLFTETEGDDPTKRSLNTEDENAPNSNHPPSSEEHGNSQCPLTASQKADVTELFSLLEEADTQFDFTQFKPAKLNQDDAPPPQRADKDLDPDFLRDIDFDDSFSSDAENHLAKMMTPDRMTSIPQGKTKCKAPIIRDASFCSAVEKGNASTGDKCTSEGSASIVSTKATMTEHDGSDKSENQTPLMFGAGFKTAGENVLNVSKKSLSKARALFADLEENHVTFSGAGDSSDIVMKPPEQQSGEMDVKTKRQPSVDHEHRHNGDFFHNYNVNTEERIKVCFSWEGRVPGVRSELSSEGRVPGVRSELASEGRVPGVRSEGRVPGVRSEGRVPGVRSEGRVPGVRSEGRVPGVRSEGRVPGVRSEERVPGVRSELSSEGRVPGVRSELASEGRVPGVRSEGRVPGVRSEGRVPGVRSEGRVPGVRSEGRVPGVRSEGRVPGVRSEGRVPGVRSEGRVPGVRSEGRVPGVRSEGRVPGVRSEEHTKRSHELENRKTDTTLCHGQKSGFQTANGKGIITSAKALQKANALFKDCDVMEGDDCMSVKQKKMSVPNTGREKRNHSKGKIFEEVVNGGTELESVNVGPVARHMMSHHEDEQIHNAAFKSPVVLSNAVPFHGNPSLSANPLPTPQNVGSSAIGELSNAGGFSTASGKKVSVSEDALTKAKSMLTKCDTDTLTTGYLSSPVQALPPQHGGFQTAGGKGVAVSVTALRKAKSLLSEYDAGAEDKKERPTHPKIPIPDPPPRNSGFFAASGKPVAFSSEALQKAKALFSGISSTTEVPDVAGTRKTDANHEDAQNNTENISCTFSTARGTRVHVSDTNMFKAKKLLNEFADGECSDSITTPRSHSTSSFDTSTSVKSTSDLTTAGEKEVVTAYPCQHETGNAKETVRNPDVSGYSLCDSVSEKALKEAFDSKESTIPSSEEDDLHDMPREKQQALVDCGRSQISSIETEGSSMLTFEPLHHMSGCTDTQQKYFAQEAMDCTKALLEDEDLDGQSLTVTLDNPGSTETRRGRGKRPGEDLDLTDQPPLRRRLLEGDDCMSIKQKKTSIPNTGRDKRNHSKGKISGELNGCTELESVNVGPVARHMMSHHEDEQIHNAGFKSPFHGNPSWSANPLPTPQNVGSSAISAGGFSTASGKKVSVSEDALTKAKSILTKCDTDTLTTVTSLTSPVPALPPQHGGFQTAGGKGVAVSVTALRKAKSLLSEYDAGVEDKKERPTHPKIPIPDPPPRNSGFFAASGKPVAFSSEALQKAKALFSGISSTTEVPDVAGTRKTDANHEDAQNNTEKISCTFSTARGTRVHVSDTNMFKAKKLLNEFADGECSDSITTPRSHSTGSCDTSTSVKSTSDLTTAGEKEVVTAYPCQHETGNAKETVRNPDVSGYSLCDSVSEKALKEAFDSKESTIPSSEEDELHDMPRERKQALVDCGRSQISSMETHRFTRTEGSPMLTFEPLHHMSGCSDTQQKYFAQEAMDCTKALLEDEDLDGQSLTVTLEEMPLRDDPGSTETRKGRGKRPGEDLDLTDQPPLRRRLLEEFDRILDSPRALRPAKSCPDGVTKDRRVFQYSISLHPNITQPHRDGKNYVETRLQRTELLQEKTHSPLGEPSHSKATAFVPPFHKNLKTKTLQSFAPGDKARTPAGFVPPFKKQRSAVQESSAKPQIQEDQLYVTPAQTNSYVPPAKQPQSPTHITDGKGREDIQTVALVETKSGPNHGTGDSAAEASGVEDASARSQEMFQKVQLARDMQDMRIRKKKRQTIRPLPGSLFLAKTSGVERIPLRDAVRGQSPSQHSPKQLYAYGVHRHVSEITSDTAESFCFDCHQFFKQQIIDVGGVQLADGGWLIPRNDGTAGKEEFYRALCDTPGVDPKLISEEWLNNHYRWIVWKQASMERSFPSTMGSLCLTPEQVLLQLKYRYDVEVDHSRRPALRKIMEKDDTAAKTLVLCVCGVVSRGHDPTRQSRNDVKTPQGADSQVENPVAMIWLTDGWYAIKAQLDVPLTAMLHKGRLGIGGKLIIHGAELVGSEDACSPLEAPESIMLKICANSSRPARWDTKLGFYQNPRPFLLPVSCLYSSGGSVGCVDVIILRSYPTQWMERKPGGGFVFRCARAEEKEARRYNSSNHKAMEILSAKIQADFEKEEKGYNKPQSRRQTLSRQHVESLQDGEELHEAVENDPLYLEAHLSAQQLETLHTYRRCLVEKKQSELQERYRRALENAQEENGSCPKRDVTPVWKLCIADSRDQLGSNVYVLNLWRPSVDLQSVLKEGSRHRVYYLTTSEGKKRTGSATLQLTATRKTQFQELQASQEWFSAHFQPRVSANFPDLLSPECPPLCGEVDLVGYVIAIIDEQGPCPVLYLVDGKLSFVKVRCSSSLVQSGLEDMVKPLALLALSNLQLRAQSSSPIPDLYAGDLALFSTNPKEVHLQEAVTQLRNLVQGQENFFLSAAERLSHFVQSHGPSSIASPALQPRTPVCRTDERQDKRTRPIRSFGSFTPSSRNPLTANSSADKDPKSLKRRRALEYLSHIPSPPALCPVGTKASPFVNKTFNPPRRSGTPRTSTTVQTPARKAVTLPVMDAWVEDEELAMIDTQALHVGNLGP